MLTIFTIVLNGSPYIQRHLEIFDKLKIPWQWRIVEGVSNPRNCTRWCREIPPKWHKNFVSIDGTHEYLKELKHPNVLSVSQNAPWDGKIEMIQKALEGVSDGVVMEIDADEYMESYNEIFNWMVGLTKPDSFDQYKNLQNSDDGLYSDASLIILDSKGNPGVEVHYKDVFPISLSPINFDTTQTAANHGDILSRCFCNS